MSKTFERSYHYRRSSPKVQLIRRLLKRRTGKNSSDAKRVFLRRERKFSFVFSSKSQDHYIQVRDAVGSRGQLV